MSFLEENILIINIQHGFRHKRSCLTHLFDLYNNLFNNYNEIKAVDIIYLDFQKAFNKVPHKRLLKQFASHVIVGKILKWLGDWFPRENSVL